MTSDHTDQELIPMSFDDRSDTFEEILPIEDIASATPNAFADEMEAVLDVPVKVKAVLGGTRVPVGELVRMRSGNVLELDRRVGEPVDVFVNGRMIARGELVLIDGLLGVTLTEIVKQDA